MKITMHSSLNSFPVNMIAPDCKWGKMCAVLYDWVKRGFRLSSVPCMACMMLPSGSMTWGLCVIVCLLLPGVFTLMYF